MKANVVRLQKTTDRHHAHQWSLDSDLENRARQYWFPYEGPLGVFIKKCYIDPIAESYIALLILRFTMMRT